MVLWSRFGIPSMMLIDDRVLEVPILEGNEFIMDCACSDIASIISNRFFEMVLSAQLI